eukprot:symbB.v1.2.004662.t1/scaffold268.1/size246746/13
MLDASQDIGGLSRVELLMSLPFGPGRQAADGVSVHSGRRSEKLLLGRDARRASGVLFEAPREAGDRKGNVPSVLSRVHAEILPGKEPGEAFLRDLASTNGSWVLGKGRVSPEDVDGEALRSGDEISLGVDPATWRGARVSPEDFRFLFRIEMPSPKRQRITAFSAPAANAPAAEVVKEPGPVVAEDLPSAAELIAALDPEEMTEKKMRRKILLSEVEIHGSFCSLVLCICAD